MAQGDLNVANQSGAAFRADLNNQLAALGTLQSGASAPSTTYAYMLWADTTAGLLKLRNAANNAWITIGTLASANLGLATLASPTFTGTVTIPAGASISGFAPLASPTFTGTPAAPTASTGTNTTQVATTAFVLANSLPTSGGTLTGNLNVPSLNGGPLAGMRNLLINGNPIINQRGYVSGTATSGANQYTLDRWRVATSGQSITFTDSANVRTVTAPAGGIEQVIEGLNILSGTYVLNWTGTATATVDGASVAKGSTVTLTGGTNATVRFIGGTFSLPQLEPGTVATPFERRSYGHELALCQRYYFAGTTSASLNPTAVTANISVVGNFPVAMRATPSIAGITASFSSTVNVTAFFNTAGSSWAGNVAFTASAEL